MELTGERTIPGVPTESYWFARHEIVYRWVAERYALEQICGDIGSGEGQHVQANADHRQPLRAGRHGFDQDATELAAGASAGTARATSVGLTSSTAPVTSLGR